MSKDGTIKNPTFWIMTALFIIFTSGAFIMYCFEFDIQLYSKLIIKSFSTLAAISACSYFLYLALSDKVGCNLILTIIFIIFYIVCCSLILYFDFEFVKVSFSNQENSWVDSPLESYGYILWAFYLLNAIGFIIYYGAITYVIYIKENNLLDLTHIFTYFFMSFATICSAIIIFIGILVIVLKAVDSYKFGSSSYSDSSKEKEYTFTNERGCQQTAYSTDGVHFYDHSSNHWISDDGGKTMHED